MDQQVYWTNLLHNPAEPENLVDYLLSPSDTIMENTAATSPENDGLDIFGSRVHSLNQDSLEERQLLASGTPSLGNRNINLNSNNIDNDQTLPEASSSAVFVQNEHNLLDNDDLFSPDFSSSIFGPEVDHFAGVADTNNELSESGIFGPEVDHISAGMLGSEHASSSGGSENGRGNSFTGAVFSEENEGRPSASFDGRRISHKRKNIEGAPEQPSASGASTSSHQRENNNRIDNLNICMPSDSISGAISGQLDSRAGRSTGVTVSDFIPSGNLTENAENSQRNSRMRICPAQQQDISPHNLWAPGNAPDSSNLRPANQQSSLTIPFSQQSNQQPSFSLQLRRHSLEPRTVVAGASSQSHSRVPVVMSHLLPQWYGASNSRLGSSPSSPIILDERRPTSRGETNTRSASRTTQVHRDVSRPPRQAAPHLVRANASQTLPGNVPPSTSSVAHQLVGSAWVPHQRTTQYESVFPSPFSTSGSGSLNHRANAPSNQQAAASQDTGHQSGAFVSGPGSLAHRASALRNQLAAASQDSGHQSGAFLSGPGSLGLRASALRHQLAAASLDTGHQYGAFISGPASLSHRANSLRSQLAAASQETGHQSGTFDTGNQSGLSVNPASYTRSVFIDGQRDGPPGVPGLARVPTAPRDGRNRMLSEIRNMLDSMRRGENLRIEDILMFDQFFAGGDVLDRHRDMRLDVDNMSYEELLALEEQIGDVKTGLNEETILKSLKKRKYSSAAVETSDDVEPCCICQEEYVDAEELGTLDCGHDFHCDCIKQWLMQKNVCPICKTTGLSKT